MSTIISESTRNSWTVRLISDGGSDIMPDILSAAPGVIYNSDADEAWVPTDDDAQWWAQWCERERRIDEALESCDDDARVAAWAAIDRASGDWEAMQRMECAALGIGYDVDPIERDMTPDEVIDEAMAR